MNQKQVIFNVGGALSVYTEWDNKKLLIDLGMSQEFNPVLDFLLPLYKKRSENKTNGKYNIDQLVISHPHKDHISAIQDFHKYFHPYLLTCPSDNKKTDDKREVSDKLLINWDLITDKNDPSITTLREMLYGRFQPLRPTHQNSEFLYWLNPGTVEENPNLTNESYLNNISIAVFLIINGHSVFMPGDLQKEAMSHLLAKYHDLRVKLKKGSSVLIAPHHGLKSSFSTTLFDNMEDGQVRCLNIVSEKTNVPEETRDVDSRYSSSDFCKGLNNLSTTNGIEKCCQKKTSSGHICINYSSGASPRFNIITDKQELINWFVET